MRLNWKFNLRMRTSDFDYHLPMGLIAQTPTEPRDRSRLMVVRRDSDQIEHRNFHDLPDYLVPGDLLVFNDSRVIPARLNGRRTDTGGYVEVLLLRRLRPGQWRALLKPGRRLDKGASILLEGTIEAQVLDVSEDGSRTIWLSDETALEKVGRVPLPPYVKRPLADPKRYQTIYARVKGSVAAPTAGLHFTPELLSRIQLAGVRCAFVTLHVGLDTFRPVQVEDPRMHKMHSEWWELGHEASNEINMAKADGRRIICVGTTSVRLVEQAAILAGDGPLKAGTGFVDLFILQRHQFQVSDAIVTNFHLPKSTLLMLVSAFAGRDRVLAAYQEAIEHQYRFYSFGDSMLIF
jgi:S-adenosylmethionine:tRNA ribosyltransferase-isomerase